MANSQATISSIKLNVKKERLTVNFERNEVGKKGQPYHTKNQKDSDQPMSMALQNLFRAIRPHLLYANELAGDSIKLGEDLNELKFFNNFEFEEIELFHGLQVTEIIFTRNDGVIDAVEIKGYRETQFTDKPYQVKLSTGPVSYDKSSVNKYKLLHVLEEHMGDIETAVGRWLEKGETADPKTFMHVAIPEAEEDKPY